MSVANLIENIKWVVIVGLVVAIVFMRACDGGGCPTCPTCLTKVKTDTLTVVKEIQLPLAGAPVPTRVMAPDSIEIIRLLDTVEVVSPYLRGILTDYNTSREYSDTLSDDSTYTFYLWEKVHQNKIVDRRASIMFRERTIDRHSVTTVTEERRRFKAFFGGHVRGSQGEFDLGPDVFFVPRNERVIAGYGYDVLGKTHRVSVGFKISFRKNN